MKQAELIQGLTDSREKMCAALEVADSEIDIYPPWKVKQLVDHLTGWDDLVGASLQAHATGQEPVVAAIHGVDKYNSESVETRRPLSEEHSLREWEASRKNLHKILQSLTEEQIQNTFTYPWGEKGTLAGFVQIFFEHEAEHAQDIMSSVEKK